MMFLQLLMLDMMEHFTPPSHVGLEFNNDGTKMYIGDSGVISMNIIWMHLMFLLLVMMEIEMVIIPTSLDTTSICL